MNFSKDIVVNDKEIRYYFRYLQWDSDFFDRPSYILDFEKSNLGVSLVIKNKLEEKIKNKFKKSFITTKIDTSLDNRIVDFLQECGFVYIDTEITLEYSHNINSKNIIDGVKIIKESENINLPYDKFGKSFSLTRFHTDLNIANSKADKLWINYFKNYKLSDKKHMFTAKVNDEYAGVILINVDHNVATLFFVAIIDKFIGRGIGSKLISEVISYFSDYIIRTGTQIKNITALNYYIKNGFSKIKKTSTVLHYWI